MIEAAPAAPAAVAPPTPPPAAPAAADDTAFLSTLTDEQREELSEAEVAEAQFGDKYKGLRARLIAFYKRFQAETTTILAADPEVVLEENDKVKQLVREKPQLTSSDSKKVLREIGAREAETRVKSEMEPKMAELETNQRRIEMAPKFEAFAKGDFTKGIVSLVEQDAQSPMAEAIKTIKTNPEEAAKEFPLETEIFNEESEAQRRRVTQFLLLKNQAARYNPKNPDPDQQYVLNFIENEGRYFAEKGGKSLVQNGRRFLPRSEFIKMLHSNQPEASTCNGWQTKGFWTFTDSNIVDMLAMNAKNNTEWRIKQALEKAEKLGLQRKPRSKNPQGGNGSSTPPKEISPPQSRATPPRGAVRTTAPAAPAATETVDVGGTLYAHLKKA